MAVKRSAFTEAMKDDLYSYFWERYPQEESVWESLFEIVDSDSAYTQFTSAIGLGILLEKPESETIQAEEPMESYTIICKNRTFARKVPFSYESVQDSKKGNLLQATVSTWGEAVVRTKETFYSNIFNKGTLTAGDDIFNNSITGVISDPSGDFIYDGLPFFDTVHPDRVGNTYSNIEASRSLTHTNLESTYLTYTSTNNRDERGNVFTLVPDVLLFNPALKFTAQVILNTSAIPGSQDNDVNVLSSIVEPQEWSYIDDTNAWFLGKRKMGLMATNREDVNLDFWQDEENLTYYARIICRYGGTPTNWRLKSQCLPTLQSVENNWVNCWEVHDMDNQQPSLDRNILEGSTTNFRFLTGKAEESNENTSAQLSIAA